MGEDGPSRSTLADDEAALAAQGEMLADTILGAVPGWIDRLVREHGVAADLGRTTDLDSQVSITARTVTEELEPELRVLLAADIAAQWETPLQLVRRATRHVNELLDDLGVPRSSRDEIDVRIHPDDHHGLGPARLDELGLEVGEVAIVWGAAKAHVHLRRRRDDR